MFGRIRCQETIYTKARLYVKYLNQTNTKSEKSYKECKNLFDKLIEQAKNEKKLR